MSGGYNYCSFLLILITYNSTVPIKRVLKKEKDLSNQTTG